MIEFSNVGLRYGQGPEILRDLNFRFSDELPRGLDTNQNALLESPEGTPILLLQGES